VNWRPSRIVFRLLFKCLRVGGLGEGLLSAYVYDLFVFGAWCFVQVACGLRGG